MSIQGFFFNAVKNGEVYDRTYNAEDFTKYLDKIISNGVFMIPSTSMQVVQGTGMQVVVKAGQGWIDGHKIINTADYILDVSPSDVVLNRIDRVVFYADYQTREMGIKIKKGENAITPIAPTLVRDTNIYEMCLAEISINKQMNTITQSIITDTRANNELCGWVTGTVREVDTTTLFIQWQKAYEEAHNKYENDLQILVKSMENEFNEWFLNVKNNLTVPKLTEYKTVYLTTNENENIIDIGINEYVVETDIIQVFINGFRISDNEFDKTQTQIELLNPLNIDTKVEIIIIKSVVE